MVTIIFLVLLLSGSVTEASKVRMTPQDVAERVIKKSYLGREVALNAELAKMNFIRQLQVFDWNFTAESNRQESRFEPFNGLPFNTGQNDMRTDIGVQKNLSSGTTLTFDFSKISTEFQLAPGQSILPPTVNIWTSSIGFSQSLWRNFFGEAWRNDLKAQESLFEAAKLQRLEDLESLILQAIQRYWAVVTAEASYTEAVQTRDRYKTLLANVKRKQSVGFANPGELAQVQAELEAREQGIYRAELAFKEVKDSFVTFLALEDKPEDLDLEFDSKQVPPPPELGDFDQESIRPVQIAAARLKAAEASKIAAGANRGPDISFLGQYGTAGVDRNSDIARQEWISADRPRAFVGLRLQWELGSDWRNEEYRNRSFAHEQENLRWSRLLRELRDTQSNLERKLRANFAVTQSLQRQKEFRKKAVDELTRSYQLGRIEIRTLIESINSAFGNEIEYLRSLGEYQVALAELLALRDELIVQN